jgi:hypothetical protein
MMLLAGAGLIQLLTRLGAAGFRRRLAGAWAPGVVSPDQKGRPRSAPPPMPVRLPAVIIIMAIAPMAMVIPAPMVTPVPEPSVAPVVPVGYLS